MLEEAVSLCWFVIHLLVTGPTPTCTTLNLQWGKMTGEFHVCSSLLPHLFMPVKICCCTGENELALLSVMCHWGKGLGWSCLVFSKPLAARLLFLIPSRISSLPSVSFPQHTSKYYIQLLDKNWTVQNETCKTLQSLPMCCGRPCLCGGFNVMH